MTFIFVGMGMRRFFKFKSVVKWRKGELVGLGLGIFRFFDVIDVY